MPNVPHTDTGTFAVRRPMRPRSASETHRAATPLELFFDLVYVVAVAQASGVLHHALVEGHAAHGITTFAMSFFAIQWAWMNFTWFASAYDCDDVPYRLLVFVQMLGALILAAGIPALAEFDLRIATAGYVIMRLALVPLWLRAARADPGRRRTALRYAAGIVLVQLAWVALLWVPQAARGAGFCALVAAEVLIPVWAERASQTPWHAHHISERYGLFTIIVLGESILASMVAIQSALHGGALAARLVPVILGGAAIVFSLWWLYFYRPVHGLLTSPRRAFVWGYGHYLVFAAAAAVGAGMAVNVDFAAGKAHLGPAAAGAAVAVPVAVYVAALVWLHGAGGESPWLGWLAAALVLATPLTGHAVPATGAILIALLAIKLTRLHSIRPRTG